MNFNCMSHMQHEQFVTINNMNDVKAQITCSTPTCHSNANSRQILVNLIVSSTPYISMEIKLDATPELGRLKACFGRVLDATQY